MKTQEDALREQVELWKDRAEKLLGICQNGTIPFYEDEITWEEVDAY